MLIDSALCESGEEFFFSFCFFAVQRIYFYLTYLRSTFLVLEHFGPSQTVNKIMISSDIRFRSTWCGLRRRHAV